MPNKQVLIVEDESNIRDILLRMLQVHGFSGIAAGNGEEALRVLEKMDDLPGLLILDLMMPVMSGLELVKSLRSNPRFAEIPFVIMSAALERIPEVEGSVGFIPKPIDIDELFSLLEKYCQ
jgi:CheY-like chemotaxis protein